MEMEAKVQLSSDRLSASTHIQKHKVSLRFKKILNHKATQTDFGGLTQQRTDPTELIQKSLHKKRGTTKQKTLMRRETPISRTATLFKLSSFQPKITRRGAGGGGIKHSPNTRIKHWTN